MYFNLNYFCNNNCRFCASASSEMGPEYLKRSIRANEFRAILDSFRSYKDRYVTINGGEPTLNKDIIKILKLAKRHKCYCTIFTNGQRMSDYRFARSLMLTSPDVISIPLYGDNPALHDSFTRTKNSFKDTMAGLNNFFLIREHYHSRTSLELKILYIRPLLKENINIAKFIIDRYPKTDTISINHLICSDPVDSDRSLIPRIGELERGVNELLEFIKNDGRFEQDKITLANFPLCLINKSNHDFIRKSIRPRYECKSLYFDPFKYCVIRSDQTYKYKAVCADCGLRFAPSDNMITVECPYK